MRTSNNQWNIHYVLKCMLRVSQKCLICHAAADVDPMLFQLHEKNPTNHVICIFYFCLSAEIEKNEGDELRKDGDPKKYLDIISNKNIKLSERVLIPIQQYPKVRDTTLTPWHKKRKSSRAVFSKERSIRDARSIHSHPLIWDWLTAAEAQPAGRHSPRIRNMFQLILQDPRRGRLSCTQEQTQRQQCRKAVWAAAGFTARHKKEKLEI